MVRLVHPTELTDNDGTDDFKWRSTPYGEPQKDWVVMTSYRTRSVPLRESARVEVLQLAAKAAFEKLGVKKVFARVDSRDPEIVVEYEKAGFQLVSKKEEMIEGGTYEFRYYSQQHQRKLARGELGQA